MKEVTLKSLRPLVTSSEGGPLLLSGHRLLGPAVPTVPGVTVTVTVAAALRERELSVALPASLLTQFVPVVLDVRLLLQPSVVRLQTTNISIFWFHV